MGGLLVALPMSRDGYDPEDGKQEQDKDNGDKDLRPRHRNAGKAVQTEKAGDGSDDEKNENPFEHRNGLSQRRNSSDNAVFRRRFLVFFRLAGTRIACCIGDLRAETGS